jgi:hypothetical protein
MWTLTEEEKIKVLRLDGPERYSYLIKKVADEEILWSLGGSAGWHSHAITMVRNWCQSGPMRNMQSFVRATNGLISLLVRLSYVSGWNDGKKGMQRDGRLVAAFPIPNGRGVEVDAGRFGYVLRQALSAYE